MQLTLVVLEVGVLTRVVHEVGIGQRFSWFAVLLHSRVAAMFLFVCFCVCLLLFFSDFRVRD